VTQKQVAKTNGKKDKVEDDIIFLEEVDSKQLEHVKSDLLTMEKKIIETQNQVQQLIGARDTLTGIWARLIDDLSSRYPQTKKIKYLLNEEDWTLVKEG